MRGHTPGYKCELYTMGQDLSIKEQTLFMGLNYSSCSMKAETPRAQAPPFCREGGVYLAIIW